MFIFLLEQNPLDFISGDKKFFAAFLCGKFTALNHLADIIICNVQEDSCLSHRKNRLCFVDFGAKPVLIGMPALETLFGHAPTAGDKNEVEFVSIRAIKEDVVNSLARDA